MNQTTLRSRLVAAISISGASLLLVGSALSIPASAAEQTSTTQAAEQRGAHMHQLHGTISSVDSSTTFSVDTERFGRVSVMLDAAAPHGRGQGHGRARSQQPTATADLKTGERVVVLGSTESDGKFHARRLHVLAVADQANSGPVSRTVATIADVKTAGGVTSLTLTLADQTSETVSIAADTTIRPRGQTAADLKPGMHVTVAARAGAATRIVVMPS